jgi:hypothetical protein
MTYVMQAHGMVIIEVDRDFDQFELLLGSHSWAKFLLRPSGEEQDKESKVFWCHYNSGRLVQKHGGSRISVSVGWGHGADLVCIYRVEASRYQRTLVQRLEPEQRVSSDALSHSHRVHPCVLVKSGVPTRKRHGARCPPRQRRACPCAVPSRRLTSLLQSRRRNPQVIPFICPALRPPSCDVLV